MICGRNTMTPPRPAITPSTSRLRSGPSGRVLPTSPPNQPVAASMASIIGVAQAYTAWKIRNITTPSASRPNTGCSSQRSNASSMAAVRRGMVTASASSRRTSSCRASSANASRDSGSAGSGPSSRSSSARAPSRRTATVSTTGKPSSRCSTSTSMAMPRRRAASIMLSATITGRPSARSSSAKRRCRRRLVASTTQTSRSGAASPG